MFDILLSIYVPTYNRADKVVEQVEFLKREVKDIKEKVEIIVNNNCSIDDTEEKLKNVIKGTDIIYHRNDSNLGIVGNVYKAIELVNGKYFWLISDDDVLKEGIIKRVLNIIKTYEGISYIFLNYTDIQWENNRGAYHGSVGLLDDAAEILQENDISQIGALMFTTSSIYLKEGLVDSTKNLSIEKKERYGCTLYSSLACLKKGKSYFDGDIWVIGNEGNKSWTDVWYESQTGVLRMFEKLKLVGYTKTEIDKFYDWKISQTMVAGIILNHFVRTKKMGIFLKDLGFCLKKKPNKVLFIYLHLIVEKIKRCF